MPFDTTILDGDFVPMNHRQVQPIAAKMFKVFDEVGTEIPGYHHLVRGDTNATIKVVPDTYTVIQNEFAIDMIEAALRQSKLDLTDARFGVDYSHDGARMFAQWILPAHTALVKAGVEASLRLVMLNSYDGTTALHSRVGTFNWVCANTAVAGDEYASFKFRHTGDIDLEPAVAKLARAAEDHVEQVRRWERWPAIEVTDLAARAVMKAMPKASVTQQDALIHAWLRARDEDPIQGGANLWCLFNVLTAWCKEKGGDNSASRIWERETSVAKLLEGKVWKGLEAA